MAPKLSATLAAEDHAQRALENVAVAIELFSLAVAKDDPFFAPTKRMHGAIDRAKEHQSHAIRLLADEIKENGVRSDEARVKRWVELSHQALKAAVSLIGETRPEG